MSVMNALTVLSAVGCGVIAGVFFAFSTSVMRSLAKLPHPHGLRAMQYINVVILNPLFLGSFLGTGISCLFLFLLTILGGGKETPGSPWIFAGSVLHLLGSFLVTVVCNVPWNNQLARVEPETHASELVWRRYLSVWTRWNHVRTAASLAAAVCFSIAAYTR